MKYFLSSIFFIVFPFCVFAQPEGHKLTPTQEEFQTTIKRAGSPIEIDGKLDESAWLDLPGVTDFWTKYPYDNVQAKQKTIARITFDDRNLYVGFIAYDTGKAFVSSLKRDGGHDGNDAVALILDPMNKHANGFFFVLNAFNAQSEDQLSSSDVNFSWDQKWFSATTRYPDRWEAEFAIPLKSIRYDDQNLSWGVNFLRVDTKTTEYSCWTRMPVNFNSHDIGYTGLLKWESPPPPAGKNMVLVPYVTAQGNSLQENNRNNYSGKGNAGFDAKVALNSSLNLDLTVNPDFSQVEVDEQVTNLTRFNIFFPERRNFFLENADLYEHGMESVRPFYSRRIGLDQFSNPVPIIGGVRLTGNATPTTRFGMLSMQTGSKGEYNTENYSAFTIQQRLLKRSLIKGYFLNREGFLDDAQKRANPLGAYGRNAGAEMRYMNTSGNFSVWGSVNKSFKPGIDKDDLFLNGGLQYTTRRIETEWEFVDLGTNYHTDMGFVERIENYDAERDTSIRLGFRHLMNDNRYTIYPGGASINKHEFKLDNFVVWNPNGTLNERNHEFEYEIEFRNMANLGIGALHREVHLLFPTDFTGGKPLPVGEYSFSEVYLSARSDFRKNLVGNIELQYGGFYNGTYTGARAGVTIRKVPHFRLQLNANWYNIILPAPYSSGQLMLISPRVDVNFTTNLFWTTFLQFNTQSNNFNINSRLQWRFRPMSDLYLVYSDNYFTDPFLVNKNRGLVMKLNYWLNL